MFSQKVIAIAGMLWTAAASDACFAQGGDGPGHGPLDLFIGAPPDPATLDSNGDGKVSQEEIKAARAAEFKTADPDGDGSLTLAELIVWMSRKVTNRFRLLDADGNGLINADEVAAGKTGRTAMMAKNLLKLGDSDGDGSLSAEEFLKMASPEEKAMFLFAAMDADGNGRVSEAEYTAPPPAPWVHAPGRPGMGDPAKN